MTYNEIKDDIDNGAKVARHAWKKTEYYRYDEDNDSWFIKDVGVEERLTSGLSEKARNADDWYIVEEEVAEKEEEKEDVKSDNTTMDFIPILPKGIENTPRNSVSETISEGSINIHHIQTVIINNNY